MDGWQTRHQDTRSQNEPTNRVNLDVHSRRLESLLPGVPGKGPASPGTQRLGHLPGAANPSMTQGLGSRPPGPLGHLVYMPLFSFFTCNVELVSCLYLIDLII